MFSVCLCVCVCVCVVCVCVRERERERERESVFLCLCTGRGPAMSWSPAQGVLPIVQDLENWSETESFMEVGQGSNWGCSATGKKKVWNTQQDAHSEESLHDRYLCQWAISLDARYFFLFREVAFPELFGSWCAYSMKSWFQSVTERLKCLTLSQWKGCLWKLQLEMGVNISSHWMFH
jgi:hypothetical protein